MTYRKGAYRSASLPRPSQPLVPRPTGAFALLSQLQATSEVDKEGENLKAIFYGVDVGMNRQRAETNSWAIFVYKTNAQLDTMSAEDVLEYAKFCRDG